MSGRRVLALYALLVGCFAAVVCRLYWLCSHADYAARAAAQSVVTLALPARRGNFYDCEGHLLTGFGTKWTALCVPGGGNYTRLFSCTDAAGQALLYQKRNAASPFLLTVDRDVSPLGISCWPVAVRYAAAPLAVQLIGRHSDLPCQCAGASAEQAGTNPHRQRGRRRPADSFPAGPAGGGSRCVPDDDHRLHRGAGCRKRRSPRLRQCAGVRPGRPGCQPECGGQPDVEPGLPELRGGVSVQAGAGRSRAGSRGDRPGLHLPRLVRGGRAGVPLCGRHPAWGGRPCRRTGKKLQRILYPAGAGAGSRAGPCAG